MSVVSDLFEVLNHFHWRDLGILLQQGLLFGGVVRLVARVVVDGHLGALVADDVQAWSELQVVRLQISWRQFVLVQFEVHLFENNGALHQLLMCLQHFLVAGIAHGHIE